MTLGTPERETGYALGKARYMHIKDLQAKAVTEARDLGAQTPIRTLLKRAQQSAQQANSLIGFRQHDRAYVEHLISLDILLNIIPKHRDYPYMSRDSEEWFRTCSATRKQVDSQHAMFMEVYNMIVEDNARSGIRPLVPASTRNSLPNRDEQVRDAPNTPPRPLSMPDGPPTVYRVTDELFLEQRPAPVQQNGDVRPLVCHDPRSQLPALSKDRPAVRPKPNGLHVRRDSPSGPSHSAPQDLAQRFSQLRTQRKPVSDIVGNGVSNAGESEIIAMPSPIEHTSLSSSSLHSGTGHRYLESKNAYVNTRPSGPRVMPPPPPTPPHPPKIPLEDSRGVSLPRAPSPAYDPSKNVHVKGATVRPIETDSSHTFLQRGPLQHAHGTSSRSSVANGSGRTMQASEDGRSLRVKTSSRDTPPVTALTAAELYEQLRSNNVLLVDVRNRAEYDQGHIFAKNIMCVEPIGLRSGISAEELEERLVVSTTLEQALFERRNEFDLVVYYDQATRSDRFLNGPPTNSDAFALRAIHDCLYEFNYYKQLRRRPVMLLGGLEAWIDLVGPQALAVSQTAVYLGSTKDRTPANKSSRPIGRVPMASANSSLEVRKRRLRDHNPLNADEERRWLEKARREEIPSADYSHAQSDSDTESTSSRSDEPPSPFVHSYDEFLKKFPEPSGIRQSMAVSAPSSIPPPPTTIAPSMPAAPSRPPPAVPRPSYSGVSDRDYSSPTSRQPSTQLPLYTPRSVSHLRKLPKTGLVNFNVTCYMNATVQCLIATLPLSNFLLEDHYRRFTQKNWKGSHGIMPDIYANLVRSLWKGDVGAIRPSSLRNLCARLNPEWGADRQQDAKEFLDFLLDCLHEDLNTNWENPPNPPLTFDQEAHRERMPIPEVSLREWQRYTHREQSFIVEYFGGQHASRLRCTTCKNTSTTYEAFYSISVEIPRKGPGDIYECLRSYCQEEKLSGDEVWKCPYCKCEREATKKITITRAPQILVVHFKRFSASKSETARKLHTPINFPLHQLNIGPYVITPPPAHDTDSRAVSDKGPATTPPYLYDCYGVMRHHGSTLSGGHYTALVKDRARGIWRKFDDTHSVDFDPANLKRSQRLQNEEAYIVFYGRALAR